jgi:hypothetical protein
MCFDVAEPTFAHIQSITRGYRNSALCSVCPSVRGLLVLAVLAGGMLCTVGEFSQGNLKELAEN